MNPQTRHSYINEGNSQDQNGTSKLYFGNHFHDHYPPNDPFQREAWTQRESRSRDGLFFGKGPKGYHRANDRIEDDVNEALTRNCYLDASNIEVTVKDSVVTLTGTVANRQMKILAEDCIESISGIKDIKNEIRLSANL